MPSLRKKKIGLHYLNLDEIKINLEGKLTKYNQQKNKRGTHGLFRRKYHILQRELEEKINFILSLIKTYKVFDELTEILSKEEDKNKKYYYLVQELEGSLVKFSEFYKSFKSKECHYSVIYLEYLESIKKYISFNVYRECRILSNLGQQSIYEMNNNIMESLLGIIKYGYLVKILILKNNEMSILLNNFQYYRFFLQEQAFQVRNFLAINDRSNEKNLTFNFSSEETGSKLLYQYIELYIRYNFEEIKGNINIKIEMHEAGILSINVQYNLIANTRTGEIQDTLNKTLEEIKKDFNQFLTPQPANPDTKISESSADSGIDNGLIKSCCQ